MRRFADFSRSQIASDSAMELSNTQMPEWRMAISSVEQIAEDRINLRAVA